jgi:hypothetical protein
MAYDVVLADRLRDILAGEPDLAEKKMFGGLAFLVAGHMTVAASGRSGMMVRVDPSQTGTLLADPAPVRSRCVDESWPVGCTWTSTPASPTTSWGVGSITGSATSGRYPRNDHGVGRRVHNQLQLRC